jgi:hypothetical protein
MSIFAFTSDTMGASLDGAPPQLMLFSINTPLNSSNLGLGVSVINDKIGQHMKIHISRLIYFIPASGNL